MFSLVKLTCSAVVDLAVLEFSSIVEILSLPFHSHHLFQQCKKGEQLSPKATKILLTILPLLLLSLLSLILISSTSCKSSKDSCYWVTQHVRLVKIPFGIPTTSPSTFSQSINESTILSIILSSLYDSFITAVNSPLSFLFIQCLFYCEFAFWVLLFFECFFSMLACKLTSVDD